MKSVSYVTAVLLVRTVAYYGSKVISDYMSISPTLKSSFHGFYILLKPFPLLRMFIEL